MQSPQTAINPLSPDQIQKTLQHFDERRLTGLRNVTILRLFYDSVFGLSELSSIDTLDLNIDDGFALVFGRGRKEKWVPYGKETGKAIWIYIKLRAKISSHDETALFITQEGSRLKPRGIQIMFRRLAA